MKKTISSFIILFLSLQIVFSQDNSKYNFWNNVQFGGGLNLSFGNNITNIGISPSGIYNFSDQFSAGLGVSYLYAKNNDFNEALNVYGGSLISLYNPVEEFELSTEFEKMFINQSDFDSVDINALYFGLGYVIDRNISIGIRYDVLYDKDKSIYGSAFSPIARIYF